MWLGPFFRRSGPAVVRHNSLHLLASVHRRGRAQPGIPRPLSPSLVVSLQRLRPPPSLPCQSLSAASNAAATAALLDLHPSSPVTAAVSAQVGPLCACLLPRSPYSRRPPEPPVLPKQVDSLLSPDVFNRPDVVLSLQVVGAPASWAAAAAAGGAGVLTHLTSDTDAVAASLAPLAGHAVQDSCAGACSDAACVATVLGGGQLLRSEVEALSPLAASSPACAQRSPPLTPPSSWAAWTCLSWRLAPLPAPPSWQPPRRCSRRPGVRLLPCSWCSWTPRRRRR